MIPSLAVQDPHPVIYLHELVYWSAHWEACAAIHLPVCM